MRWTKTEIAHGTKLERHAQAVWVVPVRLNEGMILLREGEIGDQVPVRNVIRETLRAVPALWGSKRSRAWRGLIRDQKGCLSKGA